MSDRTVHMNSHYFTDNDSLKRESKKIFYEYGGVNFTFTTGSGIFSKDRVDRATGVLLDNIPPLSGSLLDMGCGYGCTGIVLSKIYDLRLTQADIKKAAVGLAMENCAANGVRSDVLISDCFDNVDGSFDTIVINPPIHAGKAVTYRMYEGAFAHLVVNGKLYVVTLKKHGAESTRDKLNDVFGNCDTIYKKKGIYVFRCAKR